MAKTQGTKNEAKDLRAKADEAIPKWNEAKAARKAASDLFMAITNNTLAARAQRASALVASEEADLEVAKAESLASVALDAAERAEGDALATACDPVEIRAKLALHFDEQDRIRAELAAAEAREARTVDAAYEALGLLAERRRADGLPAPDGLPSRIVKAAAGPRPLSGREIHDHLASWPSDGVLVVTRDMANGIARLRMDRNELLEQLAAHLRKEEQRTAAEAEFRARKEREKQEREAREVARREEWAAKCKAEQDERERFAAAVEKELPSTGETAEPAAASGWRSL